VGSTDIRLIPRRPLSFGFLPAFTAGFVALAGAHAETISGSAVIVDGDTLEIGSQAIRICGIDPACDGIVSMKMLVDLRPGSVLLPARA
jgi:endonuclease YncB( thermonuclease family)